MDKHIKQLELYISKKQESLLQSSFFKDCKYIHNYNSIILEPPVEEIAAVDENHKEVIMSIIKQVGTQNHEREAAAFVFSVMVNIQYDLAFDIQNVIPKIDLDKTRLHIGDVEIIKRVGMQEQ